MRFNTIDGGANWIRTETITNSYPVQNSMLLISMGNKHPWCNVICYKNNGDFLLTDMEIFSHYENSQANTLTCYTKLPRNKIAGRPIEILKGYYFNNFEEVRNVTELNDGINRGGHANCVMFMDTDKGSSISISFLPDLIEFNIIRIRFEERPAGSGGRDRDMKVIIFKNGFEVKTFNYKGIADSVEVVEFKSEVTMHDVSKIVIREDKHNYFFMCDIQIF